MVMGVGARLTIGSLKLLCPAYTTVIRYTQLPAQSPRATRNSCLLKSGRFFYLGFYTEKEDLIY
jgi:hypothetical protein